MPYEHVNQFKMRDAVLNDWRGMTLQENAETLGISPRKVSYWKTLPAWKEWETALRQEMARAAIATQFENLSP